MNCEEARPLLHALIDGELDAVHAREVEAHVAGCTGLRSRSRRLPRHAARFCRRQAALDVRPTHLRHRIEAALPSAQRAPTNRRSLLKGFVAGAALSGAIAASALLIVVRDDHEQRVAGELVSAHLRSLQGDHLFDVQSSDQHSVKPWFNGRLDVSPPVVDLTAQGFTLIGGRLDYIDGKPVAALVYRRRNHVVNLFVAPDVEAGRPAAAVEKVQGFNLRRWIEAV